MFRFISRYLNPEYENCKGCEILKHQLGIVNTEKKELLTVILDLVRPKVELPEPITTQAVPVVSRAMTWGRRRAILQEQDRIKESTLSNSRFAASPDEKKEAIEALEKELDIVERDKNASQIG